MDSKKIMENIRAIRKERGLTQSEMSDKMGRSRNTYVNIETGKTRLTPEKISVLAKAFEVEEEMLLSGSLSESGTELGEGGRYCPGGGTIGQIRELRTELETKDLEIERLRKLVEEQKASIEDLRKHIDLLNQVKAMYEKRLEKHTSD